MNERIKALAEQATDKWVGGQYFDREKFAELIVKECVDVVSDAVDHREPASTYAHKILNHFGIDQ